jgi:hypothetical protein
MGKISSWKAKVESKRRREKEVIVGQRLLVVSLNSWRNERRRL